FPYIPPHFGHRAGRCTRVDGDLPAAAPPCVFGRTDGGDPPGSDRSRSTVSLAAPRHHGTGRDGSGLTGRARRTAATGTRGAAGRPLCPARASRRWGLARNPQSVRRGRVACRSLRRGVAAALT